MDYAIYPFKRYGKYRLYVQFEDQYGNEIRLSTGITYPLKTTKKERKAAKKKAKAKAKSIIEKYLETHQDSYYEATQNPRLKPFLKNDYWPYVQSNCAESTLVSYQLHLGHFLRICKDRKMDSYKRIDLERYKQQRLQKGVRKTTINIELRSIKAAFSWAYKYDLIDRTPFKGQDFMFDVDPNKRSFTKEEIEKLLKETKGQTIGLVIRLAYYTGMRIGETRQITWDLVHLEENPFIHLPKRITKTKSRDVPLSEKALGIVHDLKELLEEKKAKYPKAYEGRPASDTYLVQKTRGWGGYARRSIQDMFRKAMNKAGLPKELKFHCLRHSFATHILENGGDLYKVSKIMGHTTTQVTQQFYDHTTALNYRETANMI